MKTLATIQPRSSSAIISCRRKLRNLVFELTGNSLHAIQLAASFSQVQREVLRRELPYSVVVSLGEINGVVSVGLSWQFSPEDAPVQTIDSLFDSYGPRVGSDSPGGFSAYMSIAAKPSDLNNHWDSLVEIMDHMDRDELMEDLERRVISRTEELNLRAIELEELRQVADSANEAKSGFLANMSHELRTPMNAIIGYTEMLQEEAEDLDEEDDFFSEDLKKIHAAGKHLLSLINDVLDLSKIESGKMELYNETFDLQTLTEEITYTIHSLIEKNNNELKVILSPNLGEMHADVTKIKQSVFNLLSNAAKFTKEGSITLSVIRESINGLDWINFSVADTGIGVSKENLGKLFEEFAQADASTTRQYGGTGLGLAITKKFCEMMGGSIDVESELGVGTTFIIRLPAVVPEVVAELTHK